MWCEGLIACTRLYAVDRDLPEAYCDGMADAAGCERLDRLRLRRSNLRFCSGRRLPDEADA